MSFSFCGFVGLLTFRGEGGGVGEVQNRESPDFRSPVVGISVNSQYHQCTFESD